MSERLGFALATVFVAFLGLLDWQAVSLAVASLALVLAVVSLYRSGIRDDEVAAWKDSQLSRAQQQGAALSDDLGED